MALAPSTRLRTFVLWTACAGITLVGVAGSTGSLAAPATSQSAHHPAARKPAQRPVVAGSRYLALGDSVSFGYREPNAIPVKRNDYTKPKTFVGFPEDVGRSLGLKVANLACPGETSGSLINPKRPSNSCENSYDPMTGKQVPIGYRTVTPHRPLHIDYKGSQLRYAVKYLKAHRSVRLVSLLIGANDAFLCQERTADHCTNPSEFAAVLSKISKNVTTILKRIRGKAHYTGQIVIVQYYSLDYATSLDNFETQGFNGAMESAARPFHVRVANTYGLFKHATAQAHGDTCAAQLLTQLKGGSTPCGVHPSVAGQALIAESIERAIKK